MNDYQEKFSLTGFLNIMFKGSILIRNLLIKIITVLMTDSDKRGSFLTENQSFFWFVFFSFGLGPSESFTGSLQEKFVFMSI